MRGTLKDGDRYLLSSRTGVHYNRSSGNVEGGCQGHHRVAGHEARVGGLGQITKGLKCRAEEFAYNPIGHGRARRDSQWGAAGDLLLGMPHLAVARTRIGRGHRGQRN